MNANEAKELTKKFHDSQSGVALLEAELEKIDAEIHRRANEGYTWASVKLNVRIKPGLLTTLERRGFDVSAAYGDLVISW